MTDKYKVINILITANNSQNYKFMINSKYNKQLIIIKLEEQLWKFL